MRRAGSGRDRHAFMYSFLAVSCVRCSLILHSLLLRCVRLFVVLCRSTSGGGFSSYAAVPSYQQAAVKNYVNVSCTASSGCTLPPISYFNRSNRAFPDGNHCGGCCTPLGMVCLMNPLPSMADLMLCAWCVCIAVSIFGGVGVVDVLGYLVGVYGTSESAPK